LKAGARELLSKGAAAIGVQLDQQQLDQFDLLAAELIKWNRKINLTAITDEQEMVIKHFVDSLTLLQMIPESGSLLDIGSGGGFPSLPVKLLRPELEIVSVDAVEKKIIFQRQVARLLGLNRFTALHLRAEQLPEQYSGHFDCIVSRAFSDIPMFVGFAAPLLKEGGTIIAMKGKRGRSEVDESAEVLQQMAMQIIDIRDLTLPFCDDQRVLIKFNKKSGKQ
jgi:16S rRNA (guanine527-N7)-methyltransferase